MAGQSSPGLGGSIQDRALVRSSRGLVLCLGFDENLNNTKSDPELFSTGGVRCPQRPGAYGRVHLVLGLKPPGMTEDHKQSHSRISGALSVLLPFGRREPVRCVARLDPFAKHTLRHQHLVSGGQI